MIADASELNKLTTNALVGEAFKKAGYTCRSFHGKRNYAGTPFSKNTPNDDCAPVIPGSSVVTNMNGAHHHSPLCYCKAPPPPPDFKWVKGNNGATCDQTCANIQMIADASELNKLTTNALVGEAFKKAGYTCRSFHGKRNYAGTPFSKNTPNDDCAPVIPGSSVVTNMNGAHHHSPLCYCSQGGF